MLRWERLAVHGIREQELAGQGILDGQAPGVVLLHAPLDPVIRSSPVNTTSTAAFHEQRPRELPVHSAVPTGSVNQGRSPAFAALDAQRPRLVGRLGCATLRPLQMPPTAGRRWPHRGPLRASVTGALPTVVGFSLRSSGSPFALRTTSSSRHRLRSTSCNVRSTRRHDSGQSVPHPRPPWQAENRECPEQSLS